jgi:hypothetical protein
MKMTTNMMAITTTKRRCGLHHQHHHENALAHIPDEHNPRSHRRHFLDEDLHLLEEDLHLPEEVPHLREGDLRHGIVVLPRCYLRSPAWRKRRRT